MQRIIIDTDVAMGAPGSDIDDGFALALAVAEPDLLVELVTTVNGNTDVETATLLGMDLMRQLGSPLTPVVRGAGRPLILPQHAHPARAESSEVRERLAHLTVQPGVAAVALVEKIMGSPGEFTLICVGPLTNVALALSLEPGLAAAVKEIVIMGGVFFRHTNRAAMPGEFNIWVDPDAAAVVLESGAPLRFVGLDVTLQVRLTRADAARLNASDSEFARYAGECANGWIDFTEATMPGDVDEHGSCAMHDPLAVAAVSRENLLTWAPAYVAVDRNSSICRGVTVADLLHSDNPPVANARVATGVDVAAFTEYLFTSISTL